MPTTYELSLLAKAHIQELTTQGATKTSIARAAGISCGAISYAINKHQNFCRATSLAILAVSAADTRPSQSGRNGFTPASDQDLTKCRDHINWLIDRGVSRQAITDASGTRHGTIHTVLSGKYRTSAEVVQRLLAVTWEQVEHTVQIPIGERVREEYPFMRSLLGHEGAVRRIMDAYNIAEHVVHYHLDKEGAAV